MHEKSIDMKERIHVMCSALVLLLQVHLRYHYLHDCEYCIALLLCDRGISTLVRTRTAQMIVYINGKLVHKHSTDVSHDQRATPLRGTVLPCAECCCRIPDR